MKEVRSAFVKVLVFSFLNLRSHEAVQGRMMRSIFYVDSKDMKLQCPYYQTEPKVKETRRRMGHTFEGFLLGGRSHHIL